GTLLGLIQMLGSLDNPSAVGPAMAVALVTTLYGAICANMLFLPLAGKLRQKRNIEVREKALLVEGIISLGKQESPIIVEQKLQTFVPLANVA
ncbi:MAG: MotA/TolQ/ExbB proton channel family protein, partial [Bdellovibrionales bacterium]|nr:MotA/TolQ/ExbB proton channel family protein [Bdellovibrionales bacterium]